MTALDWHDQAACAGTDPNLFFLPQGAQHADAAAAKAICATCPVRIQCLNYALENCERFGIWGGLSERERRKLERHVRCKRCNVWFAPTAGGQVYCSKECAYVVSLERHRARRRAS